MSKLRLLSGPNVVALEKAESLLDKLFKAVDMPESHGLKHCLVVLDHMNKALQASLDSGLSEEKKLSLSLAALLHEADDHKYFGEGSSNAKNILSQVLSDRVGADSMVADVLEMISLVSASSNGNGVPDKARSEPSILWPRFCDRLEAIGVIGAVRCWQYNQEVGAPLSTHLTPRAKNVEEVWSMVTPERWKKYQNGGTSASMMDHYYDKLLQIAVFPPEVVQNTYLVQEASKRVEPLVRICLEFGRTGEAPIDLIKSFKLTESQ